MYRNQPISILTEISGETNIAILFEEGKTDALI